MSNFSVVLFHIEELGSIAILFTKDLGVEGRGCLKMRMVSMWKEINVWSVCQASLGAVFHTHLAIEKIVDYCLIQLLLVPSRYARVFSFHTINNKLT